MLKEHLKYIIDPVSKKRLSIKVLKARGERVISGILYNELSWYPIINGIPRLLMGELKNSLLQRNYLFFDRFKNVMGAKIVKEWKRCLRKTAKTDKFLKHQKDTAESFAFEWKNIYQENKYEKKNFLHFLNPFLKKNDFTEKTILDVGCGSGRFTKWAAKFGASLSVGIDLGDSVEAAYKLTKNLNNACIIQADIYNLPFNAVFDIVYSIGVLHHLPEPKKAFLELKDAVKKNGKVLIWVYNRRNNNRALYFYEPLRSVTSKMSKKLLFKLCYFPAFIVHSINYLTRGLNKIGAKKLAEKIPFFYYANFPFNMKLNDAFDVLATPKSNYYYREEIKDWFEEAKLRKTDIFEHQEAGITGVGEK